MVVAVPCQESPDSLAIQPERWVLGVGWYQPQPAPVLVGATIILPTVIVAPPPTPENEQKGARGATSTSAHPVIRVCGHSPGMTSPTSQR